MNPASQACLIEFPSHSPGVSRDVRPSGPNSGQISAVLTGRGGDEPLTGNCAWCLLIHLRAAWPTSCKPNSRRTRNGRSAPRHSQESASNSSGSAVTALAVRLPGRIRRACHRRHKQKFFPLLICESKNGESAERNSRTLVISGWLKLSTSKRRFSKTHAAQAHVLYRG